MIAVDIAGCPESCYSLAALVRLLVFWIEKARDLGVGKVEKMTPRSVSHIP
jgi:hypothetical protein